MFASIAEADRQQGSSGRRGRYRLEQGAVGWNAFEKYALAGTQPPAYDIEQLTGQREAHLAAADGDDVMHQGETAQSMAMQDELADGKTQRPRTRSERRITDQETVPATDVKCVGAESRGLRRLAGAGSGSEPDRIVMQQQIAALLHQFPYFLAYARIAQRRPVEERPSGGRIPSKLRAVAIAAKRGSHQT